ncbi:MAG: formylmethanofuran dehydrogenase subunit A [Methanosarcinaceae archaeon]|nr:formylmethanofuran dehydrogenase subunit A [Methanosarcinaceae archaeon]
MSEILIKNACVCDPLQGIDCEKTDLCIRDGKIVESVSANAKVIDAEGKLTLAGGFDGHTHSAGKINVGRFMNPNDARKNPVPGLSGQVARTDKTRAQVGYNTPNTYAIGYRYAKLGYTTICEAAMPPLSARHTHEEFKEIPILDKMGLTLLGSNWQVMEYIRDKEPEKLAAYVAWALKASRGYGVKIVNPGGGEAWGWGKNVSGLYDPVPNFDVTPAEILMGLAEANEKLNLPHSVHVHCNNLGHPGNYETTIETMKMFEKVKSSRDRQSLHVTHVQFNSYAGTGWRDFETGAPMVSDYVNGADHLTFDIGQVIFGPAVTMTADGPVEYANSRMLHEKWSNQDVELEDASGVVPLSYSPKSFINAVQWAIGLEMALLVKDPWKVMFTTDSPNGGSFVNYPEVITYLMSAKKREQVYSGFSDMALGKMVLPGIDRELSFYELAIMTRAIQSKMYSRPEKGNLAVGSDADIAIYDLVPGTIDPSTEHERLKQAFSATAYTFKDGEIVVKNGEIEESPMGRTYWVNAKVPEGIDSAMQKDLDLKFKKYYTVSKSNYMVEDEYLPRPVEIVTEGDF